MPGIPCSGSMQRATSPGQSPRTEAGKALSLSSPSPASPSKGSALSAVLPANSPACPSTHTSIHSFPLGMTVSPREPHVPAWPQLSLPLPCPSAQHCRVPTLCFFLQTMLTAISMSAIATNGVVPGRAKPFAVPRVRAAGPCRVGWLQGLFPESIPRGCQPLPSLLPPSRAGSPGPGGARCWSRHPSPKPRGADGSESRQPRLLPPPDWRGRGEPGGTRQEGGSRACWVPRAGRWHGLSHRSTARCCAWALSPGRHHGVGALAASPRTCLPCRALGSRELRQAGHSADSPTRGVIKAIYHPAAAVGPLILAAQL